MIRKLQKTYALSEQGAKDLVKATVWTVIDGTDGNIDDGFNENH